MNQKIRGIGAALVLAVWALLTAFAWFSPAQEMSEAERRPLTQFPDLSAESLLDGKFMTEFEDYTLDQFPVRDGFRKLKSGFHYYVMSQLDNNDIYITDGYAAKMEYPFNPDSLSHATGRFQYVYDAYLKDSGSRVFVAAVPDKGYYLAEENGYLAMDYEALFSQLQQDMPWATYIDLTKDLSAESYYYTDTHWRQEHLLPAAQTICEALGTKGPEASGYAQVQLERPFYGVYYGQAALPMDPEPMYIMTSQFLDDCRVYNYQTQEYTDVYNMDMLDSKDLYDVFLSGAQSLLRIECPNANSDRELIIFRDSFGSSIAPLLLGEYKTVTLVDIRYLSSQMLDRYLQFGNQDVLFLYSTLVLNNGTTIK